MNQTTFSKETKMTINCIKLMQKTRFEHSCINETPDKTTHFHMGVQWHCASVLHKAKTL